MERGWPGRKGLKPDRAHLDGQPTVAVWADKGTLRTKHFTHTERSRERPVCGRVSGAVRRMVRAPVALKTLRVCVCVCVCARV